MLNIFAKSMMTATRTERPSARRPNGRDAGRSWMEEDLPFRRHAGQRRGYHD